MERIEYYTLMAKHLNGNGALYTTSDTVEGIREEIDAANMRAEMRGYKPTQYMIVREETYRIVDDDGLFWREEVHTNRVEIYPERLELE